MAFDLAELATNPIGYLIGGLGSLLGIGSQVKNVQQNQQMLDNANQNFQHAAQYNQTNQNNNQALRDSLGNNMNTFMYGSPGGKSLITAPKGYTLPVTSAGSGLATTSANATGGPVAGKSGQ